MRLKQINKSKHGNGLLTHILILLFLLLFIPTSVDSATLRLKSMGIVEDNLLKLSLFAETSQISPFNAVSAFLKYPQDQIEIVSIDTNDSILSLWPEEPKIQNGTISFSGGTPAKGGFIFAGNVFDIYAKVATKGKGSIEIEDAKVLASDGYGTDILSFIENYSFIQKEAIPASFDTNNSGDVSITELSIGLVVQPY